MSQRRLHVPIDLRWGDLDAFNHVNNTAMLKLLEEARIRIFWEPETGESAPSTAVVPSHLESGILTVVARQEIEYLRQVPYGRKPLDVQVWFGHMGGSSLDVCFEVFSPRDSGVDQVLYARATAIIVMMDAATGRPIRLTERMRSAWASYVGEPITYAHRR